MGRIFKGQSALRITLKTFCNLEDAKETYIRYKKPNGEKGEFSAIISDVENGVIFYECKEGDIDFSGWCKIWAYVVFDDNRTVAGETTKVYVWGEGVG